MLQLLVVIIVHHLIILTIASTVYSQAKELLIILTIMSALQKKQTSINYTKAKTKFCLRLHYNGGSYLFVNEEKIYKFKADNEMSTFLLNFVEEEYLKNLVLLNLEKYLLKEMCMFFQSITMLLINLTYQTFKSI